jgi:hypothetical protein
MKFTLFREKPVPAERPTRNARAGEGGFLDGLVRDHADH